MNNQPKSDYYRDMLLTGYAETDYAKLIINPDYYKEINARTTEAQDLYDDTYGPSRISSTTWSSIMPKQHFLGFPPICPDSSFRLPARNGLG